jgi:hypothetical protein
MTISLICKGILGHLFNKHYLVVRNHRNITHCHKREDSLVQVLTRIEYLC